MDARLAALQAEARALGRPFNRPEPRPRRGFKDADYDHVPYWDEEGNFVQPWVPQEPPPIPKPKSGKDAGSDKQLLATKRFAAWASRRSMYEFQKADARRARGEPPAYPRLLLDGTPYTEDDEDELDVWREIIKEAADRKEQGLVDPWDEPMNSSDEEHIPVCYGGRYKGPVGKIHPDGFLYVVEQEGAEDDEESVGQHEDQAEEEDSWAKPQPKTRNLPRRSTNPQPRRARVSSAGAQLKPSSRVSLSSASSQPCRPNTCSGDQGQMPGPQSLATQQQPQAPTTQPRKAKQAGRKTKKAELANPSNEDMNKATSHAPPEGEQCPTASPCAQAKRGPSTPKCTKSPKDWLSQMFEQTAMRHPSDLATSPTACRSRDEQTAPDCPCAPGTPPGSPAPKRPKNAYQLFVAEEKITSVRRNSLASLTTPLDAQSFARSRTSFATLWKELPPAVRKSYEEQAAELKHDFQVKLKAHAAAAKQRSQLQNVGPSPGKSPNALRTPVKAPQTPEKSPEQVSDHPLAMLLRSPRLQLHEASSVPEPTLKPMSPPRKKKRNTVSSVRKSHVKRSSCGPDTRMTKKGWPSPKSNVVGRRLSIKTPASAAWRLWPKRWRIRFKAPPTAEWRAYQAARLSHQTDGSTATEEVSTATKRLIARKSLASAEQQNSSISTTDKGRAQKKYKHQQQAHKHASQRAENPEEPKRLEVTQQCSQDKPAQGNRQGIAKVTKIQKKVWGF